MRTRVNILQIFFSQLFDLHDSAVVYQTDESEVHKLNQEISEDQTKVSSKHGKTVVRT